MKLNKEELLKFKISDDNELLYTRIYDFMDYVYQNGLYEYIDDIYDCNGTNEILKNDKEMFCNNILVKGNL